MKFTFEIEKEGLSRLAQALGLLPQVLNSLTAFIAVASMAFCLVMVFLLLSKNEIREVKHTLNEFFTINAVESSKPNSRASDIK